MSATGREENSSSAHEAPPPHGGGQAPIMALVLMGVAGAGKTTLGRALATALRWRFSDADDFHSAANVEKMRLGVPLTDDDRAPWLAALRTELTRRLDAGEPTVLACSALRATYREALRPDGAARESVVFVQLDVAPSLAESRLASRAGHYMPASLVASQFAALEPPRAALRLDASQPIDSLVSAVRSALNL